MDAFAVPLAGFLGVLIGQVFVRGRELREMHRVAYVEWMKAARSLATWVGEEPTQGRVIYPRPERLLALNERTTEIDVIASNRVKKATIAFMATWVDPNVRAAYFGRRGCTRDSASG